MVDVQGARHRPRINVQLGQALGEVRYVFEETGEITVAEVRAASIDGEPLQGRQSAGIEAEFFGSRDAPAGRNFRKVALQRACDFHNQLTRTVIKR